MPKYDSCAKPHVAQIKPKDVAVEHVQPPTVATHASTNTILSILQTKNSTDDTVNIERTIVLPLKEGSQNDCDNPKCMALNAIQYDSEECIARCSKCGLTKEWYPLDNEYHREFDEDVQAGLSSFDKAAVHAGKCNIDSRDMGVYDQKLLEKRLLQANKPDPSKVVIPVIQSASDILQAKASTMLSTEHRFAFSPSFKSKIIATYQNFENIKQTKHTKHFATMLAVMAFVCETDFEEPTVPTKKLFEQFKYHIARDQSRKIVNAPRSKDTEAARVRRGQINRITNDKKLLESVRSYLTSIRKTLSVPLNHARLIQKHWKTLVVILQNNGMPPNMIDTVKPLVDEFMESEFKLKLTSHQLYVYTCACSVVRLRSRAVGGRNITAKYIDALVDCTYSSLTTASNELLNQKFKHANNFGFSSQKQTQKTQTVDSYADVEL